MTAPDSSEEAKRPKIKRDNTTRALIFFFIPYSITRREEDGKNEKLGYNGDYGKCVLPYRP